MRRWAWLLLAPAFIGCGSPKPETVWVDVPAFATPAEPSVRAMGLTSTPAVSLKLEALPTRAVPDPAENDNITPDQGVRFSQERAFRVLVTRLRRYYETETLRFAREKEDEYGLKESASYRAFLADLRTLFEKHSARRSPLAIKLALYAGFPSPDLNQRGGGLDVNLKAKRVEASKALVASLGELDREFGIGVQGLLESVDDQLATNRAALAVEIEEFRSRMDQQADREATEQVRVEPRLLDLQLAARTDLIGEAIPAKSVRLPAVAPQAFDPKVSSNRHLDRSADDYAQDLRIWAGIAGVELAKTPKGVRNATKEFLAWRKTFQDGPSPASPKG
ncbi:MAG: hypothetical protein ACOYON_09490 [Fimbriimonas sp.]